MYRNFKETLRQWEADDAKKPLLVVGARQTGKTYIIEEFLKETYPDSFCINLERQNEYISIFEGDLTPQVLIKNMEQLAGRRIGPGTPIFIDEIQQSERAVTALKYFCEDPEPYRVIGAGSLLGVKLARFQSSFPVGKVMIRYMYPMTFFEFLQAYGEELLMEGIREHYKKRTPMPASIHAKALRLYNEYLLTGGMPEAIHNHIERGLDPARDRKFFEDLITAYFADMTRYTLSPAEGVKIMETYNSIPRQLSKENPKFKYKDIRPYANKRDFSSSLDWLKTSGMVYKVNRLDEVMLPLKAYISLSGEKVYLSDVGILSYLTGLKLHDLSADVPNIYKGAVTENYVVQQLISCGCDIFYYKPSESMEIDIITEINGKIIPIEIKSGRHKRSVSLKNYREKYKPEQAIRLSENNFGYDDGLFSVPLYAAVCIPNPR